MSYRLSDKQLSELVLLVSVQKITEIFPRYSPAARTIYRRLARHGIIHPLKAQQEFKRQLLLAAPPHLSDKDAQALIDEKLQRHLEGMIASIEKEAKEYEERFQK
jgi:hypothetical protein